MKKIILIFISVFTLSSVFAQNNIATTVQTGLKQNSVVVQTGSDNNAEINQVNTQTTSRLSIITNASIEQTGISNSSVITQNIDNTTRIGNKSNTVQNGDFNDGIQTTTTAISGGGLNESLSQTGNYNKSEQTLKTNTHVGMWGDHITVEQIGNVNIASQSVVDGGLNFAIIHSEGNDNSAIQSLTGIFNGYGRGVTPITIDQVGNENIAEQTMVGENRTMNNRAVILQTGNKNSGIQTFDNSLEVTATLTQIGDENVSVSSFTPGNVYVVSYDDNADIYQEGNNNNSVTSQAGSYQSIDVTQTGNFNMSTVEQNDFYNVSNVTQNGNSNVSNITQSQYAH